MTEREQEKQQLEDEELEEQNAEALPDRAAMSVMRDPFMPGADYFEPLPPEPADPANP
jgi:hypothetical protein